MPSSHGSLLTILPEDVEWSFHVANQNCYCCRREQLLDFHGGKCKAAEEGPAEHAPEAAEPRGPADRDKHEVRALFP